MRMYIHKIVLISAQSRDAPGDLVVKDSNEKTK